MNVKPIYLEILKKIQFKFTKDNRLFLFPRQLKEVEVGNREYKINLDYSDKSPFIQTNILNKKATQMNFRLIEGGGKAIYFIGLNDNGESVGINLKKLLVSLFFFTKIVYLSEGKFSKIRIYRGNKGYLSTIRVSKKFENSQFLLEI